MIRVYFNGILECGAHVESSVEVREDYGMGELVRAIKAAGFIAFRLPTMKRYTKVEA